MSRIRSLSINEMNKGMNWIHQNLTEFATENNANYQYSRCLDKLGGLLSSHTRETTKRYHYWFRAREEQTFSKNEHIFQKSYLHPPAKLTGGGRANIPNVPVLYVSESLDEALLETGLLKSGKEVRVALLEYHGQLKLNQYYFPRDLSNINGRVAKQAKGFFDPFFKLMKNHHEGNKESAFHLHRLISNAFLDESHFFSSLVAYKNMYVYKNCDGIIYPGVKSLQMFNWALTTNISNQCKVHRAFKLKCNLNGENEILEVGLPCDEDKLDWQIPTELNLHVDIDFKFDKNYTPYKKPNKIVKRNS